jgi:hypothetical protein
VVLALSPEVAFLGTSRLQEGYFLVDKKRVDEMTDGPGPTPSSS